MQTLCLVRALVEASYDVEVVCYFEHDDTVVLEFEQSGSMVTLMDINRERGAVSITRMLRAYFSQRLPDIVHVQYMAPGALPVLAARLAGIRRIVATVHQPYTAGHGIHAKILLRSAALLCDHFISVSVAAEKSWFGRSGGCAQGRQVRYPHHFTLHNAVDISLVSSLSSRSPAKTEAAANELMRFFVFGYVGRVRHEKGVDILFEAFGRVFNKHGRVKLLVVGDGPDMPLLKERYGRERWWDDIEFAGIQSWQDAMRFFSVIDTVVVPSRFEGFGLSALEAMAASKPVIASDVGGLKEIIRHGESGILFENGSVEKLSHAMEGLLESPEICARLSVMAKKRAEEFDIGLYNNRIINFYKSLH
ncbi:MAG: glycosyltransferase family 4 protein [Chlorobiaceae bacterium]|nr:glycosyltransferase family 4 protein [Chlorobiaceae bacterium]